MKDLPTWEIILISWLVGWGGARLVLYFTDNEPIKLLVLGVMSAGMCARLLWVRDQAREGGVADRP